MKIVLLIRSLTIGGAERQVVTLAKGLSERGHSVTILTFYSYGSLADEARSLGIFTMSLDKKYRWDVIGFFGRYISILRALKPDIILSYIDSANIMAIIGRFFFSKVKVVWGIRTTILEWNTVDLLARVLVKLEAWFSAQPDLIVVNSQSGRRYAISRGYPSEKLRVIPNGLNLEFFRMNRPLGTNFREELGVKENNILVGMVGRLHPVKGHEVFIAVARMLAKEDERFRFVVVGGGISNYFESLRNTSRDLSDIFFWAGDRQDMVSIYNGLDFVISCSHNEGFPNVLIESMACGTPCVATDVGDSASIIGSTGEIIPTRNPVALAAALKKMVVIDSPELRKRCQRRISQYFGVSNLVQRTELLLQEIMWSNSKTEIKERIPLNSGGFE